MAQIKTRHVADSLQLLSVLPEGVDTAIDLGSGGGFPGLVLAISAGICFHLVEADQRKAAFLREAARVTQAPVLVHAQRAETAPLAPRKLMTSRAFAPLSKLLRYAAPLLDAEGTLIAMKGRNVEQELVTAERSWRMRVERFASAVHPDGVILRLSEITYVA